VHGDKYDYSKYEFLSTKDKVTIICSEHGEFEQMIYNHLYGKGCPDCAKLNRVRTKTSNTDSFIQKAIQVHGDKYDYSLVKYMRSNIEVNIVCSKHGQFHQTPNKHLIGKGCYRCGKKRTSNKLKDTVSEFIGKSKKVHGDKYDYSLVSYTNNVTKVIIVCPEHGKFVQTPKNHKKGHGCNICGESKGEKQIKQHLRNEEVNFISQYRFNDCRNELPLPFDFYLPELNICIEYDGIQHYKPVKRFGGIAGHMQTLHNDNIKTNYCENMGIKLIRIKYDEDIDNKLIESL